MMLIQEGEIGHAGRIPEKTSFPGGMPQRREFDQAVARQPALETEGVGDGNLLFSDEGDQGS